MTQSNAPSLRTRPEATRSPEVVKGPVRNVTPVAAAEGPTVGANCRGFVTAIAMGVAKREVWGQECGRWIPDAGLGTSTR